MRGEKRKEGRWREYKEGEDKGGKEGEAWGREGVERKGGTRRRWKKTIQSKVGVSTQNSMLERLDNHIHSSESPGNSPVTPSKQAKAFRRRSLRAAFALKSNKYKELTPSRERVEGPWRLSRNIWRKKNIKELLACVTGLRFPGSWACFRESCAARETTPRPKQIVTMVLQHPGARAEEDRQQAEHADFSTQGRHSPPNSVHMAGGNREVRRQGWSQSDEYILYPSGEEASSIQRDYRTMYLQTSPF